MPPLPTFGRQLDSERGERSVRDMVRRGRLRFAEAMRWRIRGNRGESAQGLLEFALVATILMLFFQGAVDYSRFLYYDSAITTAARTAAETASNHCAYRLSCAISSTATSDDWVVQAAYCEAQPEVTLSPAASTCTPCLTTSCSSPCTGTCINGVCTQDVCISPSGSRSTGQQVTVTVGYHFGFLTPLIGNFFPDRSCFSGDVAGTNHHNICSASVGQVS
jgi:Flp pilus assembly protein TadG